MHNYLRTIMLKVAVEGSPNLGETHKILGVGFLKTDLST